MLHIISIRGRALARFRNLRNAQVSLACLAICMALAQGITRPSAAQVDPAADMLARINTARVASGLPPYLLNDKLAAADYPPIATYKYYKR